MKTDWLTDTGQTTDMETNVLFPQPDCRSLEISAVVYGNKVPNATIQSRFKSYILIMT